MDKDRKHLLGLEANGAKRWALGTVLLLVFSAVYFSMIRYFEFPTFHLLLWWQGYAALLVGVIAVQSYLNSSLIISWGLAASALAGVIANYGGIGISGPPPTLTDLTFIILIGGLGGGILLGTAGFIVGQSLRYTATVRS